LVNKIILSIFVLTNILKLNIMSQAVSINVRKEDHLPDNGQWTNRFEIRSESSNRVYIVAQNIAKGHIGCSCPGWRRFRKCKHIAALGLPAYEQPVTLNVDFR